jgi:DNA helicase-2/ATP-dependent DNA helicase PcrA
VLFRAAHLSDSLELELTRRHIPFHKYGGLRFLEASHVKDLIAFLRVVENPRDEMAWFRTLQLLDGIGPGTAAGAVRHLSARQYRPASLAEFIFPAAARVQAQAYVDMLLAIEGPPAPAPAAQVERVRRFYDPILEKTYENPKVRARDLEHLEQIAGSYRSRRQFLMDLQLDPPTSTGDLAGPPMKDEDWLVLSTIHSAKGCEWDAVFVIHAADGCLPSDMATGSREEIEEEMRLAYVAMTRAKDFLYVCWPLRYYHRWHSFTDRHSYAQISRFLTDEVRRSMEAVSAPPEQPDGGPPDTGARRGDIAARIKSMWE